MTLWPESKCEGLAILTLLLVLPFYGCGEPQRPKESVQDPAPTSEFKQPQAFRYVRCSYPVAVRKSEDKSVFREAEDLAEILGMVDSAKKPLVMELPENPICSFWVEVQPTPDPASAKFILVVEEGGIRLSGSSLLGVRSGIDAVRKLIRTEGQEKLLPMGILSNYSMIPDPDTPRKSSR